MVSLEDYEQGWTQLSINHEEAEGLDSTNAFEGPEKLLEVWFADEPENIPSTCRPGGLKAVSEDRWKEMLDLVKCKVLSVINSEHVDAYLLSESSMFVFPHKLILKTCGTTTLLLGLPELLEIAALEAGFHFTPARNGRRAAAHTYRVFYSRKSFMFPDRQLHPHKSWKDEVICLDQMFPNGSAYMVGKMNGEHWYLYLTDPDVTLTPPASPTHIVERDGTTETKVLNVPKVAPKSEEDETLEVLMTNLDPKLAKQFYLENATAVAQNQYFGRQSDGKAGYVADRYGNRLFDGCESSDSETEGDCPIELTTEGHALGTVVAETCGLVDVYSRSKFPDARIDSYLFTPCGFSANAVIPSGHDTHYFTVHVTPEPHCSYASFETNVPAKQSNRETAEIIEQVVNIFKPGRFSVTLFERRPDVESTYTHMSTLKRNVKMDNIKGYKRVDKIVHDLDGYDLVFRYYQRNDWKAAVNKLTEAFYDE